MIISSDNHSQVAPYLKQIHTPIPVSHKGQNGKVLVIGGSSLFHGAVLWSAEAASAIVDMVHVASTEENNEIIKSIKTIWQTGIVISQKEILHYAAEDVVILVGNGMMRSESKNKVPKDENKPWEKILSIKNEGIFTRELVYYLITKFPHKQFVFDAGALQMMDAGWLKSLKTPAIITPHQKEFQTLFGLDLTKLSLEKKEKVVQQIAESYSCIILLKAVDDIISNGKEVVVVKGGNAGLTKGGTGDILAGITAGMSATSDPFSSTIVASVLLKKTAEELFRMKGFWYTAKDILSLFPSQFHALISQS